MSLREIATLMRRHVLAVLVVLVAVAGVAYVIKRTPPTYQESATIVFTAPVSGANPNPYASFNGALITTAGVMTGFLMGPQGQQQVHEAGGTAHFNVALVNLYNEEYPDYGDPYATVSAVSQDPAEAHATFAVVARLLMQDLKARQVQLGVLPSDRVTARVLGDPGPIVQPGSSKRTFAGLFLLAIIAVLFVATFLDKHRVRLGRLMRFLRPNPHGKS